MYMYYKSFNYSATKKSFTIGLTLINGMENNFERWLALSFYRIFDI